MVRSKPLEKTTNIPKNLADSDSYNNSENSDSNYSVAFYDDYGNAFYYYTEEFYEDKNDYKGDTLTNESEDQFIVVMLVNKANSSTQVTDSMKENGIIEDPELSEIAKATEETKGGLISDFSLWFKSPKKVPNLDPEHLLRRCPGILLRFEPK